MEVFCRCGNNCVKSKSKVIKDLNDFFSACENCKDINFKKFKPLNNQLDVDLLDSNFRRCICGKRHLDVVMAHILKIMMDEGVKKPDSTLRNVCVPLITPAYPLKSAPYLPDNSLVILSEDVNVGCAKRIVKEVPEVKGVLKGVLKDIVGVKDSENKPNTYELLGGCDLRCDMVKTPWGILCLYKYQGEIHIEVPQPLSPKISGLKKVLSKYDNIIIKHEDFLKVNLNEALKVFKDCKTVKVVSNLPYYITTPIIFKLLTDDVEISEYYFMVQKELAQRLTADINTKDYNSLSVLMRYKTDTSILFDVSRNVFLPMPNVDSAFIKMALVKRELGIENEAHFGAYLQKIFASRRKTLVNNLNTAYGFNKEKLNTLIEEFGYDFRIRAENLSLEEIVKLYLALVDKAEELRE